MRNRLPQRLLHRLQDEPKQQVMLQQPRMSKAQNLSAQVRQWAIETGPRHTNRHLVTRKRTKNRGADDVASRSANE